jgi:hypothetical protein
MLVGTNLIPFDATVVCDQNLVLLREQRISFGDAQNANLSLTLDTCFLMKSSKLT